MLGNEIKRKHLKSAILDDSMTQRKQLQRVDRTERIEKRNDEINVVDDVNSDDDSSRIKIVEHVCSRLL